MNLESPPASSYELWAHKSGERFIQTIMNSGRGSLEVIHSARMAMLCQEHDSTALITWLRNTWALVQHYDNMEGLPRLAHTSDQWLSSHLPSVRDDLNFTIYNSMIYKWRTENFSDEDDDPTPFHEAIVRDIGQYTAST